MKRFVSLLGAVALTACNNSASERQVSNSSTNDSGNGVQSNVSHPPIPPPGTGPDARTPLAEPKGPIDPRSAEAAGQVVQHYGALIEEGHWSEAERLWGSAVAAAQFDRELRPSSAVHLEIGDLGEPEGAAGSVYVTMPVVITTTGKHSGSLRKNAQVTLRRVNDVPGSTEADRRWHIERIEWKDA